MLQLSLISQVVLYARLTSMTFAMLLWSMQINILRGGSFQNPDGSRDDWHEQKMFYGIAFADVFVACPSISPESSSSFSIRAGDTISSP